MTYDANLVLDAGQTLINEAQTTAINVEGGILAWLHLMLGTLAADGDALNVRLQHQRDGTNWRTCPGGRVEQILGTLDDVKIKVPVFIPKHNTKGELTPVRLDYELSENATESFVIEKAWLEPIIGATLPDVAVEAAQSEGLYYDMAKGTVALL